MRLGVDRDRRPVEPLQIAEQRVAHARVVEIMASIDHRRFRPAVEGVDAQHGIPLPCQPVGHLAEGGAQTANVGPHQRSEEHTSELQSLMRTSYAVFSLNKTTQTTA